jgi:hypothetical protein
MQTEHDKEVIKYLVKFIHGGQAFAPLKAVLEKIPFKITGIVPDHLPYSIWQQVEHLRMSQFDILDFSRNPDYKGMNWPADYWPKDPAPIEEETLAKSIKQIFADQEEFIALLEAKDCDLYTSFAWGDGQNLLREAMLIANHNGYHSAEIVLLRRLLGAWKK